MLIRARFTKLGKVRFTSHRDIARIWERALRRAELPVMYSAGFSPRPKLHFGLALSTGHESVAEYVDIDLEETASADAVSSATLLLTACLPEGVDVVALSVVPQGPSLQEAVTSCSWLIALPGVSVADLEVARAEALALDELLVPTQRKGKAVVHDVRPGIVAVQPAHDAASPDLVPMGGAAFIAELATQPRAVRPAEFLLGLGYDPLAARVRRLNQWIAHDGDRREPLGAPATSHAHAELRAT